MFPFLALLSPTSTCLPDLTRSQANKTPTHSYLLLLCPHVPALSGCLRAGVLSPCSAQLVLFSRAYKRRWRFAPRRRPDQGKVRSSTQSGRVVCRVCGCKSAGAAASSPPPSASPAVEKNGRGSGRKGEGGDEADLGGERAGRAVWEAYEAGLRGWEGRAKAVAASTSDAAKESASGAASTGKMEGGEGLRYGLIREVKPSRPGGGRPRQ
ncbi:hypothetical protein MSAN_00825600 [Mycena sanguinolenta]|uniref:NBD domain-containing protein n=1 Tax=Mycena sanguinolenta TaxID=230812 RepID=A0A8H6YZG7_9AGAR|nr:hypothetical protein MSAN_00825600 [Mycena sanguinolenta]